MDANSKHDARSTRSAWSSAPYQKLLQLLLIVPLIIVGTQVSGCTRGVNPVTGNTRALGYSWEEEVELGQQADQQIIQQYGVYDNDDLQQYVERVGQEVLAESHLRRPDTPEKFRNTEFTFRVLDSEVVNAFALPGGYVYVTRGLLTHLNNEAQLAMVLGHEVAHVAARHSSQRAARQQLGQIGLIGGAILGQEVLGGAAGEQILGLGSQAAQLLFLSYSRENERESDKLGVEYAALAGYEAAEGSDFFRSLERIQETSGGGIPSWQSTHPDPGEREERIKELAAQWADRAPASRVDQEQYMRQIEGVVLGQNPRQGFVRNNTFYHPELEFKFPVPNDFQVQNQATQVAMVSPNQDAYIVFTFAQADSPAEAARQFAGQEGIQLVDQGQTQVNGIPAQYVVVSAQTQNGQQVRALAYFIEYGDTVYAFQGVTSAGQFDQYSRVFRRTMEGFDRLRDRSILNIEPTRIAVRNAQQRAPFQAFVDESGLPDGISPQDLAIINQVQLDETIEPGRPLKLPGS